MACARLQENWFEIRTTVQRYDIECTNCDFGNALRCWDEANGAPFRASLYRIKAGKSLRSFDDTQEPRLVQSVNVKNITSFERWNGSSAGFIADIAILLLDTYITFNAYTSPICIDYYDTEFGDIGQEAKVPIWNRDNSIMIVRTKLIGRQNSSEVNMSDKFSSRWFRNENRYFLTFLFTSILNHFLVLGIEAPTETLILAQH